MSDIATKLTYLNETKSQLKDMINYGLPTENQITNETTFRNYVKGIFEAFLESLRDSTTLYTNLPKISGNGTQITLNDTANAPMRIELAPSALSQDATPTPDSPQDIHTISGDNNVVVEGKNKYNKATSLNNTTFTTNTGVTSSNSNYITSDLIQVQPSTTYYVYGLTVVGGYDKDKNFISMIRNSSNAGSFTTQNNCYYIRIRNYNQLSTETLQNETSDITYLVLGDTAATYEPYVSQTASIDLNTFKASEVRQGAYDNPANMQRVCWFGKLIASGDIVNVTCNRNDINYAVGRATQDKNVANTSISQDTGWQTGSYTFTSTGNGYFFIGVKKTNNGSINPSEITDNDFKVSYGNEGTTLEYCKIGNYEDEFILTSGKNLMPLTNQDFTINNVSFKVQNGSIVLNGTANANITGFIMHTDNYFPITLDAGTYYFKRNLTNRSVGLIKANATVVVSLSGTSTATSTTFTLSEKTTLYLFFYIASGTAISNEAWNIMISKEDIDYEPYGTNQWYLKKNIGKVVLDGSESDWYSIQTATTPTNRTVTKINNLINFPVTDYFSNYFIKNSTTSNRIALVAPDTIYLSLDDTLTTITSGDTDAQKLTKMKAWLTSNNTTLYYVLATPTYTQITGTLETQLENIYKNMLSYKGTTNVSQINNDLPFVLGVSALEDLS